MIRFFCNLCGKSLRATESLAGRRSSCPQCGRVNRVPKISTRESGEKKHQQKKSPAADKASHLDRHSEKLLVNGRKDRGTLLASLNTAQPTPASTSAPAHVRPQGKRTETEDRVFEAVFNFARPKPKRWPMVLTAIVGLLLLGTASYFAVDVLNDTPATETKTAFELTPDYVRYELAVVELKRAKGALDVAGKGFLGKKNMPKSTLGDLAEFQQRIDSLIDDSTTKKECNEFYDSGDVQTAGRLISKEADKVTDLTRDVTKRTRQLNNEIHGVN